LGVFEELRANLDASWNISGDKFSIATSSGNVYIGSYDKK
jgi:WD40 repeat protein